MADALAIRALAHPLRLRLLDLLRVEGPSNATSLARVTGESTGATSYHLRQLARHGFIEEEPARATSRERWWRYKDRRLTIEPGDGDAPRQLLRELLAREGEALDRFLADRSRSSEWDAAAFFGSKIYRLTPSELDRFRAAFDGLCNSLPSRDLADAPRDALPVRILSFAFPASSDG